MRRIVWGRATSSNVMKVLWGLGELALPFERIDVGGSFGKTDTPEYRGDEPHRAGADLAGGRLHPVGEQRHPALSVPRACAGLAAVAAGPARSAPMSTAGWTRSRRC